MQKRSHSQAHTRTHLHREIDRETHVVRDDPVVGKVLVDDLTHDGLLVVQDLGHKVQDHVQHAGLRGESRAAVLGVRIGRHLHRRQFRSGSKSASVSASTSTYLVVNVVRAQAADDHVQHVLGQRKALKEALGIASRTRLSRAVARVAAQAAHLIEKWRLGLSLWSRVCERRDCE